MYSTLFCAVIALIMTEDGAAQRQSLEFWMRDLPAPLKDMPIVYLSIPGSHDSMTYSINRNSTLAPDAEPVLHKLYPLFRGTILRWTITQSLDPFQQLMIGIRYFDLRVATKVNTEDYFFTHGVYADEITKGLTMIKEFVKTHPEEVVILDFQHFYGFTKEHHQKLMRKLIQMFGATLVRRQIDLHTVTINSCSRLREQIIIVYRHQSVYQTDEFWQPQMMPSPWPQRDTTSGLFEYLKHLRRHPGMGFVHQAVLTPTTTFILLRWVSNLRDKCAVPVMKEVLPKLSEFSPGPPAPMSEPEPQSPLNVVIADFVEMNDAVFPRTIIQLNHKLLKNTDFVYHG